MADNKKMSVAEILAAARRQAAGGGSASGGSAPATPPVESGSAPEPAAEVSAPAEVSAAAEAPAAKPAKVKPGSMSVAEMLAAARAQKGGASSSAAPAAPKAAAPAAEKSAEKPAPKPAAKPAAKAEPKPAAAKADAKPAAAKAPALDTGSILAAARSAGKPGPVSKAEAAAKAGGAAVETAPKKKLEVPPMPVRPAYASPAAKAAAGAKGEESRRGFFGYLGSVVLGSSLAFGFASLAVTQLLWVLGLARYLFPNILTEPPSKFKVGFPDVLALGQVDERFKAQFGVWIVKSEYEGQAQIFALKTVCTHLGCTPNWLEGEQKFKCPCHGSGFYKDGVNFEGPAPRPLERYAIRVSDDGQLEVDKSRVFHEELGQWKDSSSFVPA